MLRDTAATPLLDESIAPPRRVARLRLAVGIATAGRPVILTQMLLRLKRQTRAPDHIVVCAPKASDVEGAVEASPGVSVLTGPRGLSCQRNAILRNLTSCDVLVFFDDDFIAADDYLAGVEQIMLNNPAVVMTTGRVLADGILGPGLSFEAADAALKADSVAPLDGGAMDEVDNGYGCNMSVRLEPARVHGLLFDERLPLYGWLEDADFGRQLARLGRVVKTDATRGVHLGIKLGRQPGLKLGYSQIANPVYLMRKGTMSWGRGLTLMSRNIAMNLLRSLRAEPWVDRRGRLYGNACALADLVLGRLDPQRILSL